VIIRAFTITKRRSTHGQRLSNWLGNDVAEQISAAMRHTRGIPIAIAGVPGLVYVAPGGDFVGPIDGGYFGNLADYSTNRFKQILRRFGQKTRGQCNMGFSSLSDLISEATNGGKSQYISYSKAPTTASTAGNCSSAWNVGSFPTAGGVGGTSGTGRECTSSIAGALKFANAAGGDTLHFVNWIGQANNVGSFMLVDRLWDMTYNHASATSTNVDSANRPTRYQTAALAPGNQISGDITTLLSATAHNITVTYVDQDGNTAEAAAAYAAPVNGAVNRSPTLTGEWTVILNTPDAGARYITNISQSTITSVTGVSNFSIIHPLAFLPEPIANTPFLIDGINSAFNLERIYDNACLAFITPKIANAATITHSGMIRFVSG